MAGKNRFDMKSTKTHSNPYLRLLGTLDFNELLEGVADIFISTWNPKSVAILIWDHDLETVSDKYFYGSDRQLLTEAANAFAEELEQSPTRDFDEKIVGEYENEDLDLPEDLKLRYVRIQQDGQLAAAILIAGSDVEPNDIEQKLAEYPLFLAIANGWEIREIKRENERLRSRYDDLEEQNSGLEEQTRKMIQDLTVKDALRFRTIERDKLLYEISSAVRSSVEIQQVLQNAVNNLGQKFDLSRCLILRPIQNGDLHVYEYHHNSSDPVKSRFYSAEGQEFVRAIMSKTAPCELDENEMGSAYGFDKVFLGSFGFLSGLIIPLIMRTRTIGAIFLQDCKMPRPWSIDDLTFFGALADQLSVAVENADLHEEKKLQAVTDGLTGISNRRNFNDCFYKEFERARRYAEPMTLAVVDLDFLKKINDTYGHTAGDNAIKAVASVLSTSSRSIDVAARYGGEEFCLLLPNTLLEESLLIAERIRKLISETELEEAGATISASIGVANFPLHATDPDELFKRADEALYKAKSCGRNKVYVYDEQSGGLPITK